MFAAASLEVVHSDVPASLNQAGNITYQRDVKSSFEFGRAYHIRGWYLAGFRTLCVGSCVVDSYELVVT